MSTTKDVAEVEEPESPETESAPRSSHCYLPGGLHQAREAMPDSDDIDERLVKAFQAGLRHGRALERRACWREIGRWIQVGELNGDGLDKTAERNGFVIASNVIMERIKAGG